MPTQEERLVRAHLVSRVLHEAAYYPEHPPRDETPAYKAIHHRLVVEEDRPCHICGIRHSDGSPNETHHFHLEWALAEAADAEKMHSDVPSVPLNDEPALLDWIDHSEDNLLVLCPDHHRHKLLGIHMVSHPDWIAQKYLRDGFLREWKEREGIKLGEDPVPQAGQTEAQVMDEIKEGAAE